MKRIRGWFRVSLRTLLIVLTLILIWVGMKVQRAREQKAAVDRILERGGTIQYLHEIAGKRTGTAPPGPKWLREWIGGEYFDRVESVSFQDKKVTEDDLKLLVGLRDLKTLSLFRAEIPDNALASVSRLSSLEDLDLSLTNVTDDAIPLLGSLKRMRRLVLNGTSVTDAGLMSLTRLHSLELVEVVGTRVTDVGVRHLGSSGKYVCCMLDAKVWMIDDSGEHTCDIRCGAPVHVRGSCRVPNGPYIFNDKVIVDVVAFVSNDLPRVHFQNAIGTFVKAEGEQYTLTADLTVTFSNDDAYSGVIELNSFGVVIAKESDVKLLPEPRD